jgi:hypothetical protein
MAAPGAEQATNRDPYRWHGNAPRWRILTGSNEWRIMNWVLAIGMFAARCIPVYPHPALMVSEPRAERGKAATARTA